MDLSKSYEFFQPEMCKERIHIIGCGAIGSTVAENLVRFGLTKLTLYDFDHVEAHNIANQMFRQIDIGKTKVEALAEMLCDINPDVQNDIKLVTKGYVGQKLSGYVFLCVDNIDLRREIATACKDNPYVKAMFDFRMRLVDAQHYAADWKNKKMVEDFLNSMAFSHEEAKAETPVSACNITLSVVPTVRAIVAYGVSNFINFAKGGGIRKLILVDAFGHTVDAF
ncbi:MAG: ThiF family adenylyltransferase [Clostridia bacterium]|nr:ThiF family adenylyltransferase [Clostridia bacterium]